MMRINMQTLIFLGLLLQLASSYSVNCIHDEDHDNIQDLEFDLPNLSTDPKYWERQQYSFYAYGKINDNRAGETTISAQYLTKDGGLIYSTKVNCDTKTWESKFADQKTGDETNTIETEKFTEELSGTLTNECGDNDDNIFDLILKVNNAYLMTWIFSAEALQSQTQMTTKYMLISDVEVIYEGSRRTVVKNTGTKKKEVISPLQVTTKYHAYKGAKLAIQTTGKAVITRFAFGQCNTWPKEYVKQCQKASNFVLDRSKNNVTELLEDLKEELILESYTDSEIDAAIKEAKKSDSFTIRGLGVFGNNLAMYVPRCYLTSNYYDHIQPLVHPDRFNVDESNNRAKEIYSCCVEMGTGLIWADSGVKADEREARNSANCIATNSEGTSSSEMFCSVSMDSDMIKEAQQEMAKMDN